jgi:hypothetical protein
MENKLIEYLKTERDNLRDKKLDHFWVATSNIKLDISL